MTRISRLTRILLAAAALLVALWGGTWWWVTGQLAAAWPTAVEAAAQYGWVLRAGPGTRAGFPFAAAVAYPDVTLTRPLGGATLSIALGRLDVALHVTDPRAVHLVPRGAIRIAAADAPALLVDAATTDLRIPFSGDPAAFTAQALTAMPETATQPLRVAALTLRLAPDHVDGTASTIQLTPPLPPPFDSGATLALAVTTAPAFPLAATPAESAARWQAGGGHVDLQALSLDWGPLQAAATGTGSLDASLQPDARVDLQIRGAAAALDALARGGFLAEPRAAPLRTAVGLLTLGAGGGPIRLPVTLGAGRLTVAGFPLVAYPPLDWSR